MKFNTLIALVGMTAAIQMSGAGCEAGKNKMDACITREGCMWVQGFEEKGSCSSAPSATGVA